MGREVSKRMTADEILELLELRYGSRDGAAVAKLAADLEMTSAGIQRWLAENRTPRGPASILMREWLNRARKQLATAGK